MRNPDKLPYRLLFYEIPDPLVIQYRFFDFILGSMRPHGNPPAQLPIHLDDDQNVFVFQSFEVISGPRDMSNAFGMAQSFPEGLPDMGNHGREEDHQGLQG